MQRADAIKSVIEQLDDELVISNIGVPSKELFQIKDRPQNFYMLGSMGMATPIGCGLALALEKNKDNRKVVVIDGDGSMLMNLGELVTIYAQQPKNLIIVLIDNEAYGSTGSQETYTSQVNLSKIADSIGYSDVHTFDRKNDESDIDISKFLEKDGPIFLHIKVNPGNTKAPVIKLTPSKIKNRFMKQIREH